MIENVLVRKNRSFKIRFTVKSFLSVGTVALAVILPQLVHITFGAAGGVTWLPMYLPVLLAGCLLGPIWGFGIGIASPLASFIITSAFGDPMPLAARLPFMTVELAVFATVSGLFSARIAENGWLAFPAVLLAQVAGRTVFMLLVLIFQSVSSLSPDVIWAQIQTGLLGMILQAVLVPFAVMSLRRILIK